MIFLDLLWDHWSRTVGGAFQKMLVGQNDPLTGFCVMVRYKNKNLHAEMSRNETV